jgi:hypothetical protein
VASSVTRTELRRLAPCAGSALALAGGIHAIGLISSIRLAHRLDVVATHYGTNAPIGNGGEMQPLGALEEFFPAVAIVFFVLFFSRALVYAAARSGDQVVPRWAINTWLAAGLTIIRPQRVVAAIWHAGDRKVRPARFVTLWWAGWVVSLAIVHRADAMSAAARTASDAAGATWLEAVAEIGFIATGAMLVWLVATADQRIQRLDEAVQDGGEADAATADRSARARTATS